MQHQKFTNHNRIIDRLIRTFRDAFSNYKWTSNNLEQMTWIYNNTPHGSFGNIYSPKQMHEDYEAQGIYIRANKQLLKQQKQKQIDKGLFNYRVGNILLIHLDLSRTPMVFQKKRRNFDHIGEFKRYMNGNVVVKLMNSQLPKNIIEVPIYYTKKIAESYDKLDDEYKSYFGI